MTAVEWLIENIPDLGKYIPFGLSMELHAKFQEALEMEKQQKEKMYSEEDIHKIVESYQNTMENNPTYITYNQWFEQFKKK